MTTHIARKDTAAGTHVCPDTRIHPIDTVQPPGIGIPPIPDMDVDQPIVTAALPAKRSAERTRNARWEATPPICTRGCTDAIMNSLIACTRRDGATTRRF